MPFTTPMGQFVDDPEEIRKFVASIQQSQRSSDESLPDHVVDGMADIISVDGQFERNLASAEVNLRDISPSGLGCEHVSPIPCGLGIARLRNGEESMEIAVRVLRCEPNDHRYNIGCQFVLAGMHPDLR